jgi:hypothetical protein
VNKNTYLGLALAVCMSIVSEPLLAEVSPTPEYPSHINVPATSVTEHQEAIELHKEYKEHHNALAKHHKLVATAYEKMGDRGLKIHHEEMARIHAKAATTDERIDIQTGRSLCNLAPNVFAMFNQNSYI